MGKRRRNEQLMRLLALVVVSLVTVSACAYMPGTEEATPEFSHDFGAYDAAGEPVRGESLVFTATDFTRFWDALDEDGNTERYAGRSIFPSLIIDTEDVTLDDQDRLCLTEPIVFMLAGSLEVVHEVPAGTCLEDNGRTEFDVTS